MSASPVFSDVPVEGGALRLATWGSGPLVLGIHGLTASSISLAPTAARSRRCAGFWRPTFGDVGAARTFPVRTAWPHMPRIARR